MEHHTVASRKLVGHNPIAQAHWGNTVQPGRVGLDALRVYGYMDSVYTVAYRDVTSGITYNSGF